MTDEQFNLIDTLQRKFKINFQKDKFNNYQTSYYGNLLAKADEGQLATDGLPLFNFNIEEQGIYIGGIHVQLANAIDSEGFEFEWYGLNTVIFYQK
jgi:hypothetical protein